jgi:STAS-like domain of unknown function (DUF4325)
MSETLLLESGVNGFAEDKDQAKELRTLKLLPALSRGDKVILDFEAVRYATQSFIHALIGEALQKYGDRALQMLEFKHCSPQVRSVIELVVDYSLGGFAEKGDMPTAVDTVSYRS